MTETYTTHLSFEELAFKLKGMFKNLDDFTVKTLIETYYPQFITISSNVIDNNIKTDDENYNVVIEDLTKK